MIRFDVLGPFHKGLRNCLCQLQFKSAKLNFSDMNQINSLLSDAEWMKKILDAHALGEDRFLFPLLEKINEVVFKIMEEEHQGLEKVQENLITELKTILSTKDTSKREELGVEYCRNLNDFVAHYFIHLQSEELKAIPELWKSYEDSDLMDAVGKFPSVTPSDIAIKFAEFMFPTLNSKERVDYLMTIKKGASEPVFKNFLSTAEKVLSTGDFNALKNSLK